MSRDWDDPKYKEWRRKVRLRDNGQCQMPGCKSKKSVKVHHIIKWASNPALRYNEKNGICLCRKHHDAIWGKEHHYVLAFNKIVGAKYE